MAVHAPGAVIMVRPHHFEPNPQTANDNQFQAAPKSRIAPLAQQAFDECTAVVTQLRNHGVEVHSFDDERTDRPDSVFPNNWRSTHPGGHVAIYPMFTPNRRTERRSDIVELLAGIHLASRTPVGSVA